jgi:Fe-S oxidoreductase
MGGMSEGALNFTLRSMLWLHVIIVLGFLNYLPSSKHLHLLGAVPNIFFAKLGPTAALPTPDLEQEDLEVFGASEPKHFTWKHLLDTTACTECGRCTAQCPAQATGKPLSPMKIIHDLKLAMFDTAPVVLAEDAAAAEKAAGAEVTPLIRGRITLDELWACTTCGACVEACPVLIEHVDDIVDMRRNLVLMESDFPEELQATFTALENEGNPWGLPAGSRGDWTQKVEVKVLGEGESTPLLYWVGCAGACDDRSKKVTQSVVKILNAAGVEYAVLAGQESCTGDPARRLGNEYLYQMLAKQNIETLNSHNITKVITQCPHCFNTLANEYPDLGGKYEVMHHSEFIQQLIAEGRIKLTDNGKEKITFHDPCYLGRWNGKVAEPRAVVDSLPGRDRLEMERSGRTSFCCGAGGGRMWLEEHIGKQVNAERSQEAIATGANTIAVGCPFCMTMMEDGVKTEGKGEEVRVRDLAELVAEAMEQTEPALPAGAPR